MTREKGLKVEQFEIGDKVKLVEPLMTIKSKNKISDTYTVVETTLSFGKWKAAVNDRTGHSYVMGNGEYCHAD